MATRSTITVEGISYAKLYKHWDGYPSATLPWLEKFNAQFTDRRGDDPEYKFAQLIRSSVYMADEFGLDESTETGWGVVPIDHSESYNYVLHSDGSVTYTEG
jgi:hypothetical protein